MTRVTAAAGYELWAESWDDTPSPIVAVEERVVRPWIDAAQSGRIVDVGCGTGRWTERLGAIGFDASPGMLAVAAEKRGLRGRVAVAEATALPAASGSADFLICALTLGHVRDHAAAMREFARVLRPGGTLIVSDFHPDAAKRGWRRTFRRGEQVYEIENFCYTVDELRGAARELISWDCVEATIGETERGLFERAGRTELFEAACGVPAVLATRWVRV